MTVYIDDREGSGRTRKEGAVALAKHPPLDKIGELCRLDSADCTIPGWGPTGRILVGVEVKSYDDFLSSSLDGRLQATQLPALVRDHEVRWLVLYGGIRCGAEGEIELRREPKRTAALKLKVSIRARHHRLWMPYSFGSGGKALPYRFYLHRLYEAAAVGVNVWHEADVKGVARFVGYLHDFWTAAWSSHDGLHTLDRSDALPLMPNLDPHTRGMLKVAHALPHMGFKRANEAAHYFDSVLDMFCAEESDWRQVPMVGKVLAEEIVTFIRRRRRRR